MDDEAAREVVAMQFAGGMSIARLAREWERDQAWIEEAIRLALLENIPQRYGGLKPPRSEVRADESDAVEVQESLWPDGS